jgi:large subunit ribosomal protein L9
MKVILREEVENLGDLGDLVEVANGYGRNYLIPQGLAVQASTRNVKAMEHEKRLQAQRLHKLKGAAEEFAARLEKLSLRLKKKVGEGDRLYGSVTSQEIAEAVLAAGEKVDRRKIQLEAPIKALGVFKVPVKIHPDVTAELSVTVEGEKVQADETAPADPAETSAEKAPAAEAEADSAGEAEAGEDPSETGDAEPAEENE